MTEGERSGGGGLPREFRELRAILEGIEGPPDTLVDAMEAVERSTSRFATILAAMSEHVVLQDRDHSIVWANRAAAESLGQEPADLEGRRCHELWQDRSAECPECPVGRVWESGESEEGEIASPDGRYWHVRGYPVHGPGGGIETVVEVTRDITKRRTAELEVRESEERYRTLADSAFEGIVIHEDGVIRDANRAVLEMSGYTVDDLVGTHIRDLLSPEAYDNVLGHLRSGNQGPYEVTALRKDGSSFQIEVNGKEIPYKGRRARVAAVRDLTEYRQTQEAMALSEDRYKILADNVDDIIFTVGSDLTFGYVSPSLERLTGYSFEELSGMGWQDIIVPEHLERILEMVDNDVMGIRDNCDRKERSLMLEVQLLSKGGERVWAEVKVTAIRDEEGNVTDLLGVARDISDRMAAQERFLEEKKRAELYLDLFGHDIRNINQGIMSYLELLLMKPDAKATDAEYIRNVLEQATRINDLVAKVQRLTHLRTRDLRAEVVDAGKIIHGAVDYVVAKYPEREIRVAMDPGCNERSVLGSRMLHDVFTSILDNAIRFDRNPEVLIGIRCEAAGDGKVRFEFEDRGPGVPDSMKEKVFKRLEQPEGGVKGSGLGLTVVWEVVKRLGGSVWVEDRVEGDHAQGSRFVVELDEGGDVEPQR